MLRRHFLRALFGVLGFPQHGAYEISFGSAARTSQDFQ